MNSSGHDYTITSQLSQILKYSTENCLHAITDLEHVRQYPHQHSNVDHVRIVRTYFYTPCI